MERFAAPPVAAAAMRILPVIDVRHGLAVRAVGGRRAHYRPFRSPLSPDADPLTLARRIRERWGTNALYLADLDAVEQGGPAYSQANAALWHALIDDGFRLLLDPGVRGAGDLDAGLTPGDSRVVIASETIESLPALRSCLRDERSVLGCDLRAGEAVGPEGLLDAVRVSDAPVLLLDVAAVGVGQGVPTLPLCRELRAAQPSRAVLTGGGVRSIADVRAAEAAGVSELLVASALYDGRLSAQDLRPYLPPTV
ncbi:HisA/HisF-related TIM barrel protein [Alienimonas californiensis]|uniref:Phosphoribosyl isomerase A n=1 Tax=Alienimonas californiensis TaxID=2527989 RepID=A0A517PCE7_9PLAN|nr:HisA/HisF-related TIM barrel protein [Alienimonas californiensis]QDT17054.1 Phosphoribosyl isomerase A [Alienimonas californiensis]